MTTADVARSRSPGLLALREGWPVLVSPPLIGLTYGVLAGQAGLDVPQAAAMSVLVFAGAAQLASLIALRER